MLRSLLGKLSQPEPPPLVEEDSRLALAVLLVRVARTDNHYAPEERIRIDSVLATRFEISIEQATMLRQEAEPVEELAPDTVRFTRSLKKVVPFEQRCRVVEALWEVVLADDRRDFEEDGYLRLVSKLLGVNDRDSAIARRRVIARQQRLGMSDDGRPGEF